LRLSAWGARELAACRYRFRLRINWIDAEPDQLDAWIAEQQRDRPRALLKNTPYPGLARRLWETLLRHAGTEQTPWAALSRKQHQRLADTLLRYAMPIEGKDTYKEEFVTSGGIDRKAIDFRSMALKAFPGLYAAGEVIDIDAVTGGYNFQAAWTGAWLAAEAMAASLSSPAAGTTATP
jgi:predicted Rossmann fold flavoprotein